MNQKGINKKRKRRIRPEFFIICIFALSLTFYCIAQIGLNSYNLTLSKEEQSLSNEIETKKAAIEELQTEVRSMQDKQRMLGMLGLNVQDNQNNIYIMGNGEED